MLFLHTQTLCGLHRDITHWYKGSLMPQYEFEDLYNS